MSLTTVGALALAGCLLHVEEFVNEGEKTWSAILVALLSFWIPAAINLSGQGAMAPCLPPSPSRPG
jgi:hypothetical protein